ncbi:MAG: metal ABC transporter substrate-binding protein [Acidimicrobiales bacterium]
MRRAAAALLLVAPVAAAACDGDADESDRLRVVTTVAPLTSIVANVAGDLADVTGVVPEGANSHEFEPPPSVAAVLAEADVVFINGLFLEEPTVALAEATMAADVEIVRLGDAILAEDEWIFDFSFPRDGGRPNPHLWTDPLLGRAYAEAVADTLADLDPANADAYQANFDALSARIESLDAALRAATGTVRPEDRELLTYHDGFAYFARDYGWRVVGAIQPSHFDEPTPPEVAALIEQVRAEGVRAIFGSEVFPSPVLDRIAAETGAEYVDDLRDDDLPGAPGDPEHSWLGLLRFDFVTLIEALGGDATELRAVDVTDVSSTSAEYPQ